MPGPLQGVKVLEIAAIGPAPFCGMVLSDLGAEVLRIDRPMAADLGLAQKPSTAILNRGRKSLPLDLKSEGGRCIALRLVEKADILIEGFRPGVMERIGLGPKECMARNPCLVYGRVTGWGQDGPMAHIAGHDVNYIALSGILDPIGRAGSPPTPPLNLVGDFGGGGMLLALGVLAALHAARREGKGDVVDAAMVDGAALLGAFVFGLMADGQWKPERGTNAIDSGAPWYDCYLTKDSRWMAVGAIEQRFYEQFVIALGLKPNELPPRQDSGAWPILRNLFENAFRQRTMQEWSEVFSSIDACVTPVLTLEEAASHPQNRQRDTFISVDGVLMPAPAPRFRSNPGEIQNGPSKPDHGSEVGFPNWGLGPDEVGRIHALWQDKTST